MLRHSRSRIHSSALVLTLCVAAALPGCAAPSLLITPVTSRRALQETELSSDSFFARTKIALIDVSGVLRNTRQRGLLSQSEQPVSLFLEQLDKARRDSSVKAVILRDTTASQQGRDQTFGSLLKSASQSLASLDPSRKLLNL